MVLENITSYNQSAFYEYIDRGDFLSTVVGPYVNLIGINVFAMLLFFFIFGLLAIKTKSLGMTSIVMLFIIAGVGVFLPPQLVTTVFILIGATATFLVLSIAFKL